MFQLRKPFRLKEVAKGEVTGGLLMRCVDGTALRVSHKRIFEAQEGRKIFAGQIERRHRIHVGVNGWSPIGWGFGAVAEDGRGWFILVRGV